MAKLTPDDLLTPKGDLQESVLFPAVDPSDVRLQLTSWLNDAYAAIKEADSDYEDTPALLVAANRTARKWAYFKAYEQVFIRLASSPLRAETANEASQQYDAAQIVEFRKLKDSYFDEYTALISGFTTEVEVTPEFPVSHSLKNEFQW